MSATTPQQQQSRGNSGRGRGGGRGGNASGGRPSASGRGLYQNNNNDQARGDGRGHRGRGPTLGHTPNGTVPVVSVAPTTGIPFGYVPAYLPGSSSLVEDLDQRIMVVLRDGRHLLGNFRSFDQYSNMVLDEACERKMYVDAKEGVTYYADIPLGVYIVRGDSVVLLGQVGEVGNESRSGNGQAGMQEVELEELEEKIVAATNTNVQPSSSGNGEGEGHVLEWDFDKDLLA